MMSLLVRRGLLYLLLLILLTIVSARAVQNLGNVRGLIDATPETVAGFEAHRLEIEYTRLLEGLALYVAGDDAIDHEGMTALFDIVWSRTILMMRGQSYEATRRQSGIEEVSADLLDVLRRIEEDVLALERRDLETFSAIRKQLSPFQPLLAGITADMAALEATQLDEVSSAIRSGLRKLDQLSSMVGLVVIVLLGLFAIEVAMARRAERALADYKDHLEGLVEVRTNELQLQKEKAEKALEKERELTGLQRKFVSMVSHEFRTPLAVIDGSAQRIIRRIDKLPSAKIVALLEQVRRSVRRLINLMESTLAASRLEAGTITINPASCDVIALVTEICDEHRQISSHRLRIDIDGLPKSINADEQLLRQIIGNLVSNAIKYSPDAEDVWITGRTDGELAVIAVRDEGVGIPSQDLPKLFGRFFRASTSTGIPGTGIGLNLVKHLVELHGGRIEVATEAKKGSVFTVRLPIAGPAETTPHPCCDQAQPVEAPSVNAAA
ncbi:MAG: sensor histidine kinase [Geminicoccaceae bacterium]